MRGHGSSKQITWSQAGRTEYYFRVALWLSMIGNVFTCQQAPCMAHHYQNHHDTRNIHSQRTRVHFLSRIREWHFKATKRHHPTPMSSACRLDLALMQTFLKKAHLGIDMNLLTFQQPTHVYHLDSCPFGMGGCSHSGYAWRFEIPPHLRFQ